MRKLFLLAFLATSLAAAKCQTQIDSITVKQVLKLNGTRVTAISDDTTLANQSSLKLLTERAAKALVQARVAGLSITESDPTVASHVKAITTTNISNWNTAYGWGNHASAGYLTGITGSQVTTALGFTPYNATNPNRYWDSLQAKSWANATFQTALGYTPLRPSNNLSDLASAATARINLGLGSFALRNSIDTTDISSFYLKVRAAQNNYATAAGSNSQIQFNNSGSLGASSNLIWDNPNTRLGIGATPGAFTLDVYGTARVQGSIFQTMGTNSINVITATSTATSTDRAINVGSSNTITSPYGVSIGASNSISGTASIGIGFGVNASAGGIGISNSGNGITVNGGIGIGGNALNNSVALLGNATGNNGISIKGTSSSIYGISIGMGSSVAGNFGIAMGYNATVESSHTNSIALGILAKTTSSNQIVIGGGDNSLGDYSITDLYLGNGVTSSDLTGIGKNVSFNASGGFGTDKSGGNITIAGGKATGNATPGDVIISTSNTTISGTTLQSLTQRCINTSCMF